MGEIELVVDPPQEKQKLFFKAFARYVAYGGARAGGKSWAMRTKMVLLCAYYPGLQCLLLRRTFAELQAVIFEDSGNHDSYMKSLRRDLLETLESIGCGDVIAQQRGKLGIMPDKLDCDYYDWCDGKRTGIVWHGEYMAQYSWSEYTAGVLERMNRT